MTGGFETVTDAEIRAAFEEGAYLASDRVVTSVGLACRLGIPLLVEGPSGVGKTDLARALADGLKTDLLRVQCYPGIGVENALYEWQYTKQLLALQNGEGTSSAGNETTTGERVASVFDEEYLLERPLLAALRGSDHEPNGQGRSGAEPRNGDDGRGRYPPIVLVDGIDRADEAFEALLLEVLSDFQVTIPELGTLSATRRPLVVLTASRQRPLSGALRRRCLYCSIDSPPLDERVALLDRILDSASLTGSSRNRSKSGIEPAVDVARELVIFADRFGPATGSTSELLAAGEALSVLDRVDRAGVRAALRATFVTDPASRATFENRFPVLWARLTGENVAYPANESESVVGEQRPGMAAGSTAPDSTGSSGSDGEREARAGSDAMPAAEAGSGGQHSHDGASEGVTLSTETDPNTVETGVAALTRAIATLPGRRFERETGTRIDARRALRVALQHGGVPLTLPERTRQETRVRGTVLVDVSGSVLDALETGFLLDTLRAIRSAWDDTPIFFFDTGLREVSGAFDARTTAGAIDGLAAMDVEWGGGTRLGGALSALHHDRPDTVGRRRTVVIISDGIAGGELASFSAAMAWLSRRAGSVLWLNPLAADPDWAPNCRGMRAAMPFIDGLYGLSGPDDLSAIADSLVEYGPSKTLRTV